MLSLTQLSNTKNPKIYATPLQERSHLATKLPSINFKMTVCKVLYGPTYTQEKCLKPLTGQPLEGKFIK